MREMVSFDLGKEMEKDVCLSCHECSTKKNSECFYAVSPSHRGSMESKGCYKFHIQNVTLTKLMILTVCRRRVIKLIRGLVHNRASVAQ